MRTPGIDQECVGKVRGTSRVLASAAGRPLYAYAHKMRLALPIDAWGESPPRGMGRSVGKTYHQAIRSSHWSPNRVESSGHHGLWQPARARPAVLGAKGRLADGN